MGYPFDQGPGGGGATILKPVSTLFRVNRANGAGRTLDVRIENLAFTRMSTFINTDNANVTLDNVAIYGFVCQRSSDLLIVHGLGGSLTIKDSLIFDNLVNNGQQDLVINNDLTIINSAFSNNSNRAIRVVSDRLVSMTDSTSKNVIIRDSYFDGLDSGALEFKNASVEISNSVYDGRDATPTRAIKVIDGDLTLTNSTWYYTSKTINNIGQIFQGTHIELAGSAQLIARNNLLLSTNSATNTIPLVYPANWDDTGVFARAVNDNNYLSRINGDDSALNLSPLHCVNASFNRNCFVPNALSTPLVDQGNTADALYGDGAPISEDLLGELRAQGASVDIGAYEKHETLYAHADHYQTNEGVNLIVSTANGVLSQ
ncbi:MAG: hypothetical protein MK096_11335 [Oleiphilaceae bacterium]|nr:hypothetical protein [Oleiphilaceae bacterium]